MERVFYSDFKVRIVSEKTAVGDEAKRDPTSVYCTIKVSGRPRPPINQRNLGHHVVRRQISGRAASSRYDHYQVLK